MTTHTAGPSVTTSLDVARQVADAVLYEGYVLFPYRASAAKNQYRWQWGVVVPADDVDRVGEPDEVGCDLLVHGEGSVRVTARFLRLRHRQVRDAEGNPVDRLEVDGEPVVTWDEGEEVELTAGPFELGQLVEPNGRTVDVSHPEDHSEESLDGGGTVERRTLPVDMQLHVDGQRLDDRVTRVRLRVRNTTAGALDEHDRLTILRRALVGVHLLVVSDHGATLGSLVDPPDWADPWTDECERDGLHPVVVGPPGDPATVMLCSPIILSDHPEVAPESPGPSFDATEVDELLALAVMGLTEDEKREARATDERAAEIVDRSDNLPPEVMERLHGRLQENPGLTGHTDRVREPSLADRQPAEDVVSDEVAELLGIGEAPTERVRIGAQDVPLGAQVRLRPQRRADAHDLFVEGRVATVERIVTTIEGDTMVGVTLVDDPAAELHRWYGRFQYFALDEVVPVEDGGTRG